MHLIPCCGVLLLLQYAVHGAVLVSEPSSPLRASASLSRSSPWYRGRDADATAMVPGQLGSFASSTDSEPDDVTRNPPAKWRCDRL